MRNANTTENLTHDPDVVPEWGDRRKCPEKLSLLRRKLYQKAKREPKFRFYTLYERIYRKDVLQAGWEQVRRNKGAAGVDRVTIDQIVYSEGGPERRVEQLHQELRTKTFSYGYPRVAKRQINTFIRSRLTRHLRRRSQRPFHPSKGVTFYRHLANPGLVYL